MLKYREHGGFLGRAFQLKHFDHQLTTCNIVHFEIFFQLDGDAWYFMVCQ
jgi:hypothetical protein